MIKNIKKYFTEKYKAIKASPKGSKVLFLLSRPTMTPLYMILLMFQLVALLCMGIVAGMLATVLVLVYGFWEREFTEQFWEVTKKEYD